MSEEQRNTIRKMIPSSEYLSLELTELSEDVIPSPEDPIKDLLRTFWLSPTNDDSSVRKKIPLDTEDEKEKNYIYLKDNAYYTSGTERNKVTIVRIKNAHQAQDNDIEIMTARKDQE